MPAPKKAKPSQREVKARKLYQFRTEEDSSSKEADLRKKHSMGGIPDSSWYRMIWETGLDAFKGPKNPKVDKAG